MPDRVLILANDIIRDPHHTLPEDLRRQAESTREVLVIAPLLATRLQSLCSDIDPARRAAHTRLTRISQEIRTFRPAPFTQIGDENQIVAVADALSTFAADACVVVTREPGRANHRERGVPDQISTQFGLPVTTLTVDAAGHLLHQGHSHP